MATELTKNKGKQKKALLWEWGDIVSIPMKLLKKRTVVSLMVFFCFAFIERLTQDLSVVLWIPAIQ